MLGRLRLDFHFPLNRFWSSRRPLVPLYPETGAHFLDLIGAEQGANLALQALHLLHPVLKPARLIIKGVERDEDPW
jgi:hypothetical protein